MQKLLEAGHNPCLVPQVLYEFWVVATRPREQNGLALSPQESQRELAAAEEIFQLLRDERGIYASWRNLVSQFGVCGKPAHDARLVAAMQRHGLTHLVTFDKLLFERFGRLATIWTPSEITSGLVGLT